MKKTEHLVDILLNCEKYYAEYGEWPSKILVSPDSLEELKREAKNQNNNTIYTKRCDTGRTRMYIRDIEVKIVTGSKNMFIGRRASV